MSHFCISAGITIFFLFLLTATFFLALLTLDERRRARRALDTVQSEELTLNGALAVMAGMGYVKQQAHRVLGGYARALTHPLVAALTIVLFLSFIPVGFAGAIGALKMGANLEDYFPDGSYYAQYTMTSMTECGTADFPDSPPDPNYW